MPFGTLLLLAALVLPLLARRDVQVGDGIAAGRVARFRVAAEIAEQDHLVDRSHVLVLEKPVGIDRAQIRPHLSDLCRPGIDPIAGERWVRANSRIAIY